MKTEDCIERKVVLATKKSICDKITDKETDDRFETFLKESPFGIGIIYNRYFCPEIQETVIIVGVDSYCSIARHLYCFKAEDLVEIERGE